MPGWPADTRFTLTFVAGNSLIGSRLASSALPGNLGAYVWADNSTSASYTPSLNYQWTDLGGPITITRSWAGAYTVNLGSRSDLGTHVQVTAYGTGSEHCKLAGWHNGEVFVRCFDSAGRSVDTRFTLAFLGDWNGI